MNIMMNMKVKIDTKHERATTGTQVMVESTRIGDKAAIRSEHATPRRIARRGWINRPTALFVDKSRSMELAIDAGRHLSAMISGVAQAGLWVYAFDTLARPVEAQGNAVGDWARAFAGIQAGGEASLRAPLEALRLREVVVEQIVLVTGGCEHDAASFAESYDAYSAELGLRPDVVIVQVGAASDAVARVLRERGARVDTLAFAGSYHALTKVVLWLTRPARSERLMDIHETPLSVR